MGRIRKVLSPFDLSAIRRRLRAEEILFIS
jgi:hypothetical protein